MKCHQYGKYKNCKVIPLNTKANELKKGYNDFIHKSENFMEKLRNQQNELQTMIESMAQYLFHYLLYLVLFSTILFF